MVVRGRRRAGSASAPPRARRSASVPAIVWSRCCRTAGCSIELLLACAWSGRGARSGQHGEPRPPARAHRRGLRTTARRRPRDVRRGDRAPRHSRERLDPHLDRWRRVSPQTASRRPVAGLPIRDARPSDPLAILYTSGTTGPPKGVVCPHGQFCWWGQNTGRHSGSPRATSSTRACRSSTRTRSTPSCRRSSTAAALVVGQRFSASRFWQTLVDADATVTYILGAMASILAAHDPGPLDRAHRVRVALSPATSPPLHEVFRDRFGVEIVEGHGMTETNPAIGPRDGEQRPGWMGRAMPGFQAKVVDDDDDEVPPGRRASSSSGPTSRSPSRPATGACRRRRSRAGGTSGSTPATAPSPTTTAGSASSTG